MNSLFVAEKIIHKIQKKSKNLNQRKKQLIERSNLD